MKMKHAMTAFVVLALTGAVAVLWLEHGGLSRVPAISLTTLQGKKLDFQDLRGRPVLVNFWATSCPTCVREIPHLGELYRELEPDGFLVIGISMPYDPPNRVLQLSQTQGIPYPVALDIDGSAARAFGGIKVTPTSFLIAPDGRVVHQHSGALDIARVRSLLAEMLGYGSAHQSQVARR